MTRRVDVPISGAADEFVTVSSFGAVGAKVLRLHDQPAASRHPELRGAPGGRSRGPATTARIGMAMTGNLGLRVSTDPTRIEAGSSVADQLTAEQRPPGLSVAFVDGDRPAWSKGFGFADLETRRPAEADTVFPWFSMTKIVTATATMQLSERGGS